MGHVHRPDLLISVLVEDSSCSVGQQTVVAAVLLTRFDVEQEYQLWERSIWVDDSSGNSQLAVVPQPNIAIYGTTCHIRVPNPTPFVPWARLAAVLANLDVFTFLVGKKNWNEFVLSFQFVIFIFIPCNSLMIGYWPTNCTVICWCWCVCCRSCCYCNTTGNRHIDKARRHNLNTQTHAVTTPNIEY